MTVWLVEKRAVYQHGILGVFKWEQDARLCAEAAVKDPGPENRDWAWDGDGHHTYVLMRVELGASDPTPVDVAELVPPLPRRQGARQGEPRVHAGRTVSVEDAVMDDYLLEAELIRFATEDLRAVLERFPSAEARRIAMLDIGLCRHCGGLDRRVLAGERDPCQCWNDE